MVTSTMLVSAAQRGLTVAELLDELLDGQQPAETPQAAVRSIMRAQPVSRRARRDGTAQRKVYVVLRGRTGKPVGMPELPHAYNKVWAYMLKAKPGAAMESRTIQAALGIPQKTVESALNTLRNLDVPVVKSFYPDALPSGFKVMAARG